MDSMVDQTTVLVEERGQVADAPAGPRLLVPGEGFSRTDEEKLRRPPGEHVMKIRPRLVTLHEIINSQGIRRIWTLCCVVFG